MNTKKGHPQSYIFGKMCHSAFIMNFESVCKRTQLFLPLCLRNYSPMMDSNPQSDHLNDDNYAEEFNHINNTAVV